ncbi:MAG: histidine kinase [Flavobacteriales bacterium]|nr:histidine kinase [Flavobacteriales bacterium]
MKVVFPIYRLCFIAIALRCSCPAFSQNADTTIVVDGAKTLVLIPRDNENQGEPLRVLIEYKDEWYLESWFVIGALVLLAFIAFLVFRFFLSNSRKSALARARISELERSALQSQMNPHFIFNSLNSIQSYIANNENEKASRYLAKFSRLVRATLNNSRSGKITLEEEIEAVTHYLELEKMRFKEKFDYDITVDEDIMSSELQLPPMLIQPYLENAIIHGLAQTRSKGRISLYYLLIGNYLVVTVTDNGIGIEQSKKLKEGNKSLHKSVGMTITQKRLEMLDEGNNDNKVKIEEVKDRKGEVLGTKVEVKIRVQ